MRRLVEWYKRSTYPPPRFTLKHGPIKSLGMDEGMTMVFSIDPAALKGIKAGDKVMFQPERVNGQLTVTKIEKVK